MIRNVRSRNSYDEIANRLLNGSLAFLILLIIGPLLMFVALAIRWESPGPALERRLSITRDGRRFRELNFRVTEYDGTWPGIITRVGWFLLYTRIASLPQLINVLRGEMTLIEMCDKA
jgi:lipopolysaccharide/colanic/teichoic acid biosynthesis glycosyltransferase